MTRWDETWHRLREWTNGQAPSERLAAHVLTHERYTDLDPSHPLGGKDGGKDALCRRDGLLWLMAAYFPRGQQSFSDIQKKFLGDAAGVPKNGAQGFAFVTNQELSLSERSSLKQKLSGILVEIYHLERVAMILDTPAMRSVRKQFLDIDLHRTVPEVLDALTSPERDEHEVRQAIAGIEARKHELLTRGMEDGSTRCHKCGSKDVIYRCQSYGDETLETWTCGECGEHLGDCV